MKHEDYKKAIKNLKPGDRVRLRYRANPFGCIRIPAGTSMKEETFEGPISEVNECSLTVINGWNDEISHSWRRIVSIEKIAPRSICDTERDRRNHKNPLAEDEL